MLNFYHMSFELIKKPQYLWYYVHGTAIKKVKILRSFGQLMTTMYITTNRSILRKRTWPTFQLCVVHNLMYCSSV